MPTTLKSLTFNQIRKLRSEAAEVSDAAMLVYCDVALDERADDLSDYVYRPAERDAVDMAFRATQEEAFQAIVNAINSAEVA